MSRKLMVSDPFLSNKVQLCGLFGTNYELMSNLRMHEMVIFALPLLI